MFRAKTNIGEGPSAIIAGEIYELEMIFANRTNLDKSRVELTNQFTGMMHVVTSKQLNEEFEELD